MGRWSRCARSCWRVILRESTESEHVHDSFRVFGNRHAGVFHVGVIGTLGADLLAEGDEMSLWRVVAEILTKGIDTRVQK
jgi:hypothetical protein